MDVQTLKLLSLVRSLGSFAATARRLDLDPSSVSRSVAAAEAELGFRIFERSTRHLVPTEAGEAFLVRTESVTDAFDQALDVARAARHVPEGRLRLTASVAFGEVCLLPHLAEFRERYPKIALDLVLSDANLDLLAERVDLAVRLAPELTGELVATRLMSTCYRVCAAPDYLRRHGHPGKPEDLRAHACLRLGIADQGGVWRFRSKGGDVDAIEVSGPLTVSTPLALRSMARRGLGPALLADWLVAEDLERGDLIDLFPQWEAYAVRPDTAAWLVYPSRRFLPVKTRIMVDFLKNKLRRCMP